MKQLMTATTLVAGLSMSPLGAEVLTIPGPDGPLAGALLAVEDAMNLVVLIPGSGPIDRDGNGAAVGLHSDSYRLLAEALAAAGIASLRIDKRGFFGSDRAIADPNDVTIAAYAQDARAWVASVTAMAPCVWLAGHSEGGLVALVAAQDPPPGVCGLLLLATAGRPVSHLMIEQMKANPANDPYMAELTSLVTSLAAGEARPMDDISPGLHAMFHPGLQRYMMDLFSYDPVQTGADLTLPTLIVQGAADLQVKVEDAHRLHAAITGADLTVIGNMTHMLKSDVPGQPLATYTDPTLPVHPALADRIAAFIHAQTTGAD